MPDKVSPTYTLEQADRLLKLIAKHPIEIAADLFAITQAAFQTTLAEAKSADGKLGE